MFPCSLQRFKIKFELPNCHSGPVWLKLNHNNEKKQQTHGKDVTKLGRPGDNSKQDMATVRSSTHCHASFGTRLELGEIDADIGQYVLDDPAHRARPAGD